MLILLVYRIKKNLYAKEMNFDIKAPCNKSTRDRTLIKYLNQRV